MIIVDGSKHKSIFRGLNQHTNNAAAVSNSPIEAK
jgi:hypothetical protein